jgi:hypothetical protein
VGVGVVARVLDPEALVVEYVEGRTLAPEDFEHEERISVLAALLRRLHACERFDLDFDMVGVQRRYHEIVTEHGYPLPEDYAGSGSSTTNTRATTILATTSATPSTSSSSTVVGPSSSSPSTTGACAPASWRGRACGR